MKKKINLYWYQHKNGHGNFGDELNPYIVEKLTGKKVKFVGVYYFGMKPILFVKVLTFALLRNGMTIFEYLENLYFYFIKRPKVLVAIGSVLQTVKTSNCIVWGTGIINSKSNIYNADFRAVRGKRTQQRLREFGYKVPEAIGDPAILLPLLYKPKVSKKYKMGIIPHFIHFHDFHDFQTEDIKIINLLDPIEKVIDDINSCELTFSTSLHGIIVSHTYQVPSVWCTNVKKKLDGDDVKFDDYFSSVDINIYKPIDINILSNDINKNLSLLRVIEHGSLLPQNNTLNNIQYSLLKVFPFKINNIRAI